MNNLLTVHLTLVTHSMLQKDIKYTLRPVTSNYRYLFTNRLLKLNLITFTRRPLSLIKFNTFATEVDLLKPAENLKKKSSCLY